MCVSCIAIYSAYHTRAHIATHTHMIYIYAHNEVNIIMYICNWFIFQMQQFILLNITDICNCVYTLSQQILVMH